MADLMVGPHLDLFAAAPEWGEVTVGAANLVGWLDRMIALPLMQATTWERVAAMAAHC